MDHRAVAGDGSLGGPLEGFLQALEALPGGPAGIESLAGLTGREIGERPLEAVVLVLPDLQPKHLQLIRQAAGGGERALVVVTEDRDLTHLLLALQHGAHEVLHGSPSPVDRARALAVARVRTLGREGSSAPEAGGPEDVRKLERLQILFEHAPDAWFTNDFAGRLLDGNRKAEELTGYRREELIGRNFLTLNMIAAEDLPRCAWALARTALGFPTPVTLKLKARDGRWVPIEVLSYPVRIHGHREILAIARDITQRVRMEEELRASRESFQDIVERTRDGILVVRPGGEVLFSNAAAAAMLGRESDRMVGRRFRVPEVGTEGAEVQLPGPGTALMSVVPTQWHGQPAWLVVLRDVTAQRHTEKALRTKEEELLQAQKMHTVGRLAGGIAHDFNNLLTAILASADFLLEELPSGDLRRERAEEIRSVGERAAAMVRQLLAFSRRQLVQPRILGLNDLVRDTERLLARLMGDQVELVLRLDPQAGRVEVDPVQMEQVLVNLAVNALDAMAGGGRLEIETGRLEVEGRAWCFLRVRDDGCGMTPQVMASIFEPFFTTKGLGQGTGLGLSTVYGIVQQAGGQVRVDSRPGEGSTFEILLPPAHRAASDVARPEDRTRPAAGNGAATLLLVEDEDVVRRLGRQILERTGYRVLEAEDGARALEICQSYPGVIDLMITDVIMPRMNGPEVARRAEEVRRGLRVIFTSGYTDSELAQHGVLDPSIAFLPKPFTALELVRRVQDLLETRVACD